MDAGGMLFDMASIATIAVRTPLTPTLGPGARVRCGSRGVARSQQSLRVLELADNGLNSVAHLCYLGGLQDLVLSGNQIADKQVRLPPLLCGCHTRHRPLNGRLFSVVRISRKRCKGLSSCSG